MSAVIQPTTFTNPTGVLIADYISGATANPPYGNYNIAGPTLVGGVRIAAALEIQSTTGGVVFPRMTTVQRLALTPVVNGTYVYDATANDTYAYENGAWGVLGGGDVVGPGGATNDAIPVFNGVTGKLLQATSILINPIGSIISGIVQAASGSGTAAAPTYSFSGDNNSGVYSTGADTVGISAGGKLAFEAIGSTTGVNNIAVSVANTGLAPIILANGTDTNIDLDYVPKGTGSHVFGTNLAANIAFKIVGITNVVNHLETFGSVSANGNVNLSAVGTDTDLNIQLITKGNGAVVGTNAFVVGTGTIGAAAAATVRVGSATATGVAGTTLAWNGANTGGVSTLNPTAPNRTVAVVINGTTYYLAAKTTND